MDLWAPLIIVPYINNCNADVLQQDNARPHTAHRTRNVLKAAHINVLDWPSRSPDMAPIELVWDYLGNKVRERDDMNNVGDPERALHEEWDCIPLQFIRTLVNRMRRQCLAVIEARGGHTRYWQFHKWLY